MPDVEASILLFVAESAVRAIREALKCRGRQSDGMRDNSTY